MRDFNAVEALAQELLQKYPQHVGIRRAWSRTLVALDRRDEARPHWQTLLDLNPRDAEAAHHLAQQQKLEHQTHDFRHIAICGVSFCGSTLLDRVLGSLPGCANISESHWLTGARLAKGYTPIDFDAPDTEALRYCTTCGRNCRVLTMPFRRSLAADATNWHGEIAQQLGTRVLISADKNPPKLVDLDPLMRFDALVLFKSPVEAWMSTLRKLPKDQDAAFYRRKCEEYLKLWTDRYLLFLEHFTPQGRVVFLHFDAFARVPRKVMPHLCEALDLPCDLDVLETGAQRHAIGGNPDALPQLYSLEGKIEIAPPAEPDCPADHLRMIAATESVQEVFGRLLERAEFSLS